MQLHCRVVVRGARAHDERVGEVRHAGVLAKVKMYERLGAHLSPRC